MSFKVCHLNILSVATPQLLQKSISEETVVTEKSCFLFLNVCSFSLKKSTTKGSRKVHLIDFIVSAHLREDYYHY